MAIAARFKTFLVEIPYFFKQIGNAFKELKYGWQMGFYFNEIITLNGVKLSNEKQILTPVIFKSILKGNYEAGEYAILCKVIEKGDVVFEIGTGLGYNSISAAKITGSQNVFSFEANSLLIPIIKKNYALNSMEIQVENCLLVNEDYPTDKVEFYVSEDFWESNTVFSNSKRKIEIPKASFMNRLEKIKPTTLICDIEGGEISLLFISMPDYIKKIILDTHPFFDHVGDKSTSDLILHLLMQGFTLKTTLTYGFVLYLERK